MSNHSLHRGPGLCNKDKEIKDIKTGEGKSKLSLFADNIILYVKNLQNL